MFRSLLALTLSLGAYSATYAHTIRSAADLQDLSQAELEEVFSAGTATAIPDGEARGTALSAPDDLVGVAQALLGPFVWQGKVFHAEHGFLYNRVLGGLPAVPARLYLADSILDGEPVVVVDYTGTGRRDIGPFDELRRVGPGVYLGMGYLPTPLGYVRGSNFVLEFGAEHGR